MKKMITMLTILLVTTGALFAGSAKQGQIFEAEDSSPALWVHNKGSEKVTFTCYEDSGATNRVTVGSVYTTIDMSSVDTITKLAAAILTVTNSAGKYVLEYDAKSVVLGTETMDDELLVGSNSLEAGEWGAGFLWDTSDTKHFRVYLPPSGKGATRGRSIAKSVAVNAGGTGNVTTSAYLGQDKIFSSVSVVRVDPASHTNIVEAGVFDLPLDVVVGPQDGLTVSAARATTASTGGILLRAIND